MFKKDLEKAEEPEMKWPTSLGSSKKQEIYRKTSTSVLLTAQKPLTMWITNCGRFLKRLGIPDHLTCLLRNLYAGQEAATDWFKIGKGVQGCILSPCLFNFHAEYLMQNARLDESQAGIKIAWRNIKTSDMQMTPPLRQKAKN